MVKFKMFKKSSPFQGRSASLVTLRSTLLPTSLITTWSPSHCGPQPLLVSASGCLWALCFSSCLCGKLQGKSSYRDPKSIAVLVNWTVECRGLQGSEQVGCWTGNRLPSSGSALPEHGHPEAAAKDQHGSAWSAGREFTHAGTVCTLPDSGHWPLYSLFYGCCQEPWPGEGL